MSYLTNEPIDAPVLAEAVGSARRGGVVTFVGRVRDHHGGRSVRRLELLRDVSHDQLCGSIEAARVGL